MNVTDRQILHGGIGRDYAQHRAAKIDYVNLSTVTSVHTYAAVVSYNYCFYYTKHSDAQHSAAVVDSGAQRSVFIHLPDFYGTHYSAQYVHLHLFTKRVKSSLLITYV